MLVTVLLALLAVTLAATGGTANTVNASCQPGRYFGGIEITVTTIKSALAGARVAGVYFDNTDAGTGYSDAVSGFDDSRCSGTGWNANMDYCDTCNLTADLKNSKILVVVHATGDDTAGYEVQQSKLDITVTNVNNLVIKKDTNIPGNMKVAKPEEGYGTVNSVNIKYSQMFNTKASLTDICYCPATIGCNYPKGDCYNFKTFSMDGMLFLAGGIIHSDRAITDVNFNNITFFGATAMTINLFPGIYQGGSQGHNADMDGVKRLKFTNVTATPGKFDLTIEGNALDVQWDKLTSAAPITFVTTTRTSLPDIFCTVPGCTDTAYGKMNLHSIKNSNLFDGSSILVQGWVEKIETSQFVFTASGTAPDKWNIKSKYAPTGSSRDYNVGQADFFGGGTAGTPGTTIDPDIHFSICKANFNNVSMTNHIQSESDNVDVKDSIFNGYIRHVVGFSLAINSAIYNGDTYYDHFTEAKYNYPTAVLNTITLANKDFVVSVDNGTMDELLDLNTIICGHSGGAANWLEPTEGSRVFLVRHMSQRITMNTVTGCNLYFKNTINNKQTTRQIDLGLPQTFTYDSLVATNTMNNYAFFDDAAYHVTTNINIENNPSIGYIKFNRVDIDNQSEGGDIHPPEVDPLGRSGYGTSYPVNMVIKNNTIIHHFYVTNSDAKGMVDPTSNATGNCATGGHGNSLKRDITQNVRHKTHQNDDVNLTMENNEILTITIDADSLKADILKLLNLGNTSINLADSSSVRIRDSRFRDVLMECHEAFELTLRHTITDGITGFTGGKGSLYDFRSVNFYNMDRTTHEYGTQVPVTLEIQSGYMNLDHIKIEYGQLSIMNLLGDIKVVQSLGVLAPARFDIMSKFGTVNVTHPDKYYRNMNEVIDFEFKSGSILDFEYAKTDSFIFEVAPSMRVTASNFRNLEPTIISSYVQIASEYGSVTWEYAKNLDISAVKSVSSADTLEFAGYDNIVAVSSISAAGHEGFFDFDIENLDFSKMYFVTIHDTNGASNDVVDGKVTTSNSGNKYECKRADTTKENDPFDACYGYLILPTVDLNAADFDLAKQPSLVIDSVNVFLKDCASSALNKLEIKGAGSVWASSIVASSLSVTLKYHMYSSYLWWRNTTYLGLFSITAKSVDVIGVADMGTDATVSLNSSAALKIYPTHVTVKSTGTTGVNYGARAAYPTLGVPTITGACTVVQEGPYSSCNNQIATPEGSTFDFDSKFADATPSNVNISLGSGVNGSILLVTHGTSKQLKDFVPAATAVIAANEHIVIDNHRFATSYATSFNYGYEGFDTPIPTTNNVYVIPTKNAFSAIVHFDTDADGMLYNTNSFTGSTVDTLKTHKFNLAEQAVLYLYVPAADGISITTAGDNINLYLGDIGTYSRIYTTSLVVANVLRAKTVDTVAAAVFSLQGSGAFNTNFGYVGINADKASAKILLESPENEAGNYAQTPNVILQKAKLADIGIYSRRYKTITDCDVHLSYGSNVNCKQVVVPCKEELCDIVNYIWEPTYKLFWVGKDFDKSTKNNDSMYVRFDTSLEQLLNACPNDGRDYGTIHCPNTPLYDEIIDFMSTVIIRGSPKISSSFEATANKNNRSVNPVNLGEVQVDAPGMPGWAIGLIVITCVIAAVVLVMFVLRLLGKESLSDFGSTTVGALGPTN